MHPHGKQSIDQGQSPRQFQSDQFVLRNKENELVAANVRLSYHLALVCLHLQHLKFVQSASLSLQFPHQLPVPTDSPPHLGQPKQTLQGQRSGYFIELRNECGSEGAERGTLCHMRNVNVETGVAGGIDPQRFAAKLKARGMLAKLVRPFDPQTQTPALQLSRRLQQPQSVRIVKHLQGGIQVALLSPPRGGSPQLQLESVLGVILGIGGSTWCSGSHSKVQKIFQSKLRYNWIFSPGYATYKYGFYRSNLPALQTQILNAPHIIIYPPTTYIYSHQPSTSKQTLKDERFAFMSKLREAQVVKRRLKQVSKIRDIIN